MKAPSADLLPCSIERQYQSLAVILGRVALLQTCQENVQNNLKFNASCLCYVSQERDFCRLAERVLFAICPTEFWPPPPSAKRLFQFSAEFDPKDRALEVMEASKLKVGTPLIVGVEEVELPGRLLRHHQQLTLVLCTARVRFPFFRWQPCTNAPSPPLPFPSKVDVSEHGGVPGHHEPSFELCLRECPPCTRFGVNPTTLPYPPGMAVPRTWATRWRLPLKDPKNDLLLRQTLKSIASLKTTHLAQVCHETKAPYYRRITSAIARHRAHSADFLFLSRSAVYS